MLHIFRRNWTSGTETTPYTEVLKQRTRQDKTIGGSVNPYCNSKYNRVIVCYQFNTYNQGSESIDEYITELHYQIGLCDYGGTKWCKE